MEKLGIENLKKAVTVLAKSAQVGFKIAEDGKVDFNDVPHLMVLIDPLRTGIPAFKSALPEAFDIDSAEGVELVAHVASELNFIPEKAKNVTLAVIKFLPPAMELKAALSGK